ncbi:mannose-6-phosphate isomerase [Microbacterium sp. SORGH_AS 505]|uniref:mannose-6-phosphate isomerase, class I n=1 Tax=Microbacterium sp. SORGH_AS_0505 TaxID=3041770 RepID=UPI00278214C0|nr:mannose-6-phosphate isomerase, class I [Microbacterium sp. SORGH_AS_0505]MDQ1125239.1 mannose-6-phosphate isomerase [Microbacterium sp. SORGH_AS_0505]
MLETLANAPRDYSWGSPTAIPELQGRTPTGTPEAEVWFGDHPGSPAILGDGRTLADARTHAGEPPLPFLLKILAASSSLSIQAHPDLAQAKAGYAAEEAAGVPRDAAERVYRDDNHKPEIIVALSERFRALVGLRPVADTDRLLAGLGEASGVMRLRHELTAAAPADALRAVIEAVLSGRADDIVTDVSAAIRDADVPGFEEEIDVLRAIVRDFPGDAGIVVALLMNLVVLRAGEAVFAPAGVLHAYQDGLGVELMAASDNVLRGGLTPKHIDVPELMRIVDTEPADAPVLAPRGDEEAGEVFDAGVPDFLLTRHRMTGTSRKIALEGPAIVLATAGAVSVAGDEQRVDLVSGAAAYAQGEDSLTVEGVGVVYIAQPGRRR